MGRRDFVEIFVVGSGGGVIICSWLGEIGLRRS
jgi:hypothetical protein